MFCPKYKRQTLATFFMLLYFAVCKETQAGVLVLAGESKKEGVRGLGACTWSCQ